MNSLQKQVYFSHLCAGKGEIFNAIKEKGYHTDMN